MAELRIRRSRTATAPVLPSSAGSRVLIVSVGIDNVHGAASDQELLKWLQCAIDQYHNFRGGWVGTGDLVGITKPHLGLIRPL